jgi:hypothetical protein
MKERLLYHYSVNGNDSCRVSGSHDRLTNAANIWGNCSDIRGNAQNLTGNITGFHGDVSGLSGDGSNSVVYSAGGVYIGDITTEYADDIVSLLENAPTVEIV